MAAAVLGSASRRLGGSGALRQTQGAAVSRLSSRFAHTEAQPNPHCSCKFGKDAFMKATQKKKEELYEAMAEWHKKYGEDPDVPGARLKNKSLLRDLSNHVERTGDPTWERAKSSYEFHYFLKITGGIMVFVGGPYVLYKWCTGVYSWMAS